MISRLLFVAGAVASAVIVFLAWRTFRRHFDEGEGERLLPLTAVVLALLAVVWSFQVFLSDELLAPTPNSQPPSSQPIQSSSVPDIVKKDCQKLVDGQLLFEPSKTMRQGTPYIVFARLSRNPGVNITEGLNGTQFVVVKETVSCKVSMSLDAEEANAFTIEKMPAERKDEQFVEPGKYSQWDWRVTPKKHGPLHLLLFVTPMLYVDGIGEEVKQFKQPPRVITVLPDYWYETRTLLKDNWAIISGLLTVVLIPLFLWFRKGTSEWFKKRFKKKEKVYTLPPPDKGDSAKA